MTGRNGLMQRRRVGMVPIGVVTAGVFARIEKQPYDIRVPMLRGKRERAMPGFRVGRREESTRIREDPQPGRHGEVIHACAAACRPARRLRIAPTLVADGDAERDAVDDE